MKRIIIIIAALSVLSGLAQAQVPVCTVSGTLYLSNTVVWPFGIVEIKKAVKSGYVFGTQSISDTASVAGYIEFTVPRGSTVWLYSKAVGLSEKGFGGVPLTIPDAATAELSTLIPATAVPTQHIVAIPLLSVTKGAVTESISSLTFGTGLGYDETMNTLTSSATAVVAYGDSIRIADSLARLANTRVLAPPYADSIRVADSLARLANTRVLAPLHADSIRVADSLARLARTEVTAKQNALSAAQLARIDTVLIPGVRVIFTIENKNLRIDIDTTGFFALYGGVKAESDPTAIKADTASLAAIADSIYARLAAIQAMISATFDSSFAAGQRSMYTDGRLWTGCDTITFTDGTDVINLALGNNYSGTLTKNDTLSFTNIPTSDKAQIIQVMITNAGAYTLLFQGPAWAEGVVPVITAVAGKRCIFSFLLMRGMVQGVSAKNF